MEVAEVSSFLYYLRKALYDEVDELTLRVRHIVLLDDNILREVYMDLHVLDEELNLGQIVVR